MTIEELKENIKKSEIQDGFTDFETGYNMAMRHALMMVEMFEKHMKDEYPLGFCPQQE